LSCLGVVASAAFFASDCAAQTDPDELARRHFESGAAYFEQAEYDSALREFRKAYELSERPQILRNISIVEERLGHLDIAVAALDEYLSQSPDDVDVETVRIRRNNLQKRLVRQREEAATAGKAPPGGRPPKPGTPPPGPQPGAAPKKAAPVPTVTEPATAPPPTDDGQWHQSDAADEPDAGESAWNTAAYVGLGIAGLATGGAVVTGVLAQKEHEYLSNTCKPDCSATQTAKGEELALTSSLLTGGAVLVAGTALAILLWHDDAPAEDSVALRLGVSPAGGFASAGWRF